MDIYSKLQSAVWQFKKRKAQLLCNDELLMEMNFRRGNADVQAQGHRWQIKREAFWCSAVSVAENDTTVLSQKNVGFWRRKSEIVIQGRNYVSKVKQLMRAAIVYCSQNEEIIEYRTNGILRKPRFIFNIKTV